MQADIATENYRCVDTDSNIQKGEERERESYIEKTKRLIKERQNERKNEGRKAGKKAQRNKNRRQNSYINYYDLMLVMILCLL